MQLELMKRGLKAETESKIKVTYKGVVVGEYQADLLVEEQVIVELKVAREYQPADEAQLLNELKATGIRVGLLINFGGTKVESNDSFIESSFHPCFIRVSSVA